VLIIPRLFRAVPLALAVVLCTSCSSGDTSSTAQPRADSPYPSSIVAIGHSGLTGYNSVAGGPVTDFTENSWATGTNPEVDSVYQRIVALNPAAEGNAANFAIDGSTVDSLVDQEKEAAAVKPTPDLVIIQSIDNDIQCDGTDPQNFGPYRRKLTGVMDTLTRDLPHADVFFVSQWATVKEYDRVAALIDPSHISGTGPCDPIDLETRKLDPKHEAYLQHLVDRYWGIVTAVCAQYPLCRTDHGAMKKMRLQKRDLGDDLDHLSVAGHAKMAALAWKALYG
jgi:lysophospholipase L1-like esterase